MLYIALLIFLLVVVLYQVYRMTEYFTSDSQTQVLPDFTPTEDTKVSEVITFIDSLPSINKSLKKRIDTLPDVVSDASLTDDEIAAFSFNKVPDPKNPNSTVIQMLKIGNEKAPKYFDKTTAKAYVKNNLDMDLNIFNHQRPTLDDMMTKKNILPTDTLKDASMKANGKNQLSQGLAMATPIYAKMQKIYNFYDKFATRNTTVDTTTSDDKTKTSDTGDDKTKTSDTGDDKTKTDDTTTDDTTTDDTTTDDTTAANSVDNIKVGSLWPAIGPIGSSASAAAPSTTDQTTTVPNSTPATVAPVELSDETEKRIVKDIMTQLKDKLMIDRTLDNPQDSSYSNGSYDNSSTCTEQGSEWKRRKPDMSKYIRKDSIPCWNCSP